MHRTGVCGTLLFPVVMCVIMGCSCCVILQPSACSWCAHACRLLLCVSHCRSLRSWRGCAARGCSWSTPLAGAHTLHVKSGATCSLSHGSALLPATVHYCCRNRCGSCVKAPDFTADVLLKSCLQRQGCIITLHNGHAQLRFGTFSEAAAVLAAVIKPSLCACCAVHMCKVPRPS
jgi:hypothetical protein